MPQPLTMVEFAALYEEAAPSLWCIAAAILIDRAQAEDALQEAALIGLQKIQGFQRGTSFAAWMGQIVRNVARNLARRDRRGPRPAGDLTEWEEGRRPGRPGEENPVALAGGLRKEQNSFDDQMLKALNSLHETARACLLLRTVLDAPYRHIAQVLEIPEGTAMSHVHRARQELARILQSGHGGGRAHERQEGATRP